MNFPCEDCITLPMCKSEVMKYCQQYEIEDKNKFAHLRLDIVSILERKCCIFKDYAHSILDYDDYLKKMDLVQRFF